MPLVALITDAMAKCREIIPQVSLVHLSASTLAEARQAVFIFTSPENILGACGRALLTTAYVADNVKAVFIDEFHIIAAWLVLPKVICDQTFVIEMDNYL